jgi:hypothetical protein
MFLPADPADPAGPAGPVPTLSGAADRTRHGQTSTL